MAWHSTTLNTIAVEKNDFQIIFVIREREIILGILAEPILELQIEVSVRVNYMMWRRGGNEDI